jgi:hypothetical protein
MQNERLKYKKILVASNEEFKNFLINLQNSVVAKLNNEFSNLLDEYGKNIENVLQHKHFTNHQKLLFLKSSLSRLWYDKNIKNKLFSKIHTVNGNDLNIETDYNDKVEISFKNNSNHNPLSSTQNMSIDTASPHQRSSAAAYHSLSPIARASHAEQNNEMEIDDDDENEILQSSMNGTDNQIQENFNIPKIVIKRSRESTESNNPTTPKRQAGKFRRIFNNFPKNINTRYNSRRIQEDENENFYTLAQGKSPRLSSLFNTSKNNEKQNISENEFDESLEQRKFADDVRKSTENEDLRRLKFNLQDIQNPNKSYVRVSSLNNTMQTIVNKPKSFAIDANNSATISSIRRPTINAPELRHYTRVIPKYSPIKTRSNKTRNEINSVDFLNAWRNFSRQARKSKGFT